MVEAGSDDTVVERRAKMFISYHSLLLWRLNDVSVGINNGDLRLPDFINTLLASLPPEVMEKIAPEVAKLNATYSFERERALFEASYYCNVPNSCGSYDQKHLDGDELALLLKEHPEYLTDPNTKFKVNSKSLTKRQSVIAGYDDITFADAEFYRKNYAPRLLALVIQVLDEFGLLREFKREEVGEG